MYYPEWGNKMDYVFDELEKCLEEVLDLGTDDVQVALSEAGIYEAIRNTFGFVVEE